MNEELNQKDESLQTAAQLGSMAGEAAKKIGQKAAETAAKEGGKAAGKAAAETAAGAASAGSAAATGGASLAVEGAVEAATVLGKLGDVNDSMKTGLDGNLLTILLALAICALTVFISIFGVIHYYLPSPVQTYIENQYMAVESDAGAAEESSGGFFSNLFNMLKRTVVEFLGFEYKEPSRYDVVYEDSLNTDITIIKNGLTKAFEEVAPKEVRHVIKEKEYDFDLTWESWEWNVNFAEFMIILNEDEDLAINEFEPEAYQEFMQMDENLQYLYYLEFTELWRYTEEWTEPVLKDVLQDDGSYLQEWVDEERTQTWDVPAGETTLTTPRGTYHLDEDNTILWAEVVIFKYDLLDLCEMVGVDIYGVFQYSGDDYSAVASNWEMYKQDDSYDRYLMYEDGGPSYQEQLLRTYSFDVDLGPNVRSPLARHYHNGLEDPDDLVYGPEEGGEIPVPDPMDPESISDAIRCLLEWLYSKVGNPYSQKDRDDGYHFDCSSLVYYAYRQLGINVAYRGSNTAAAIAQGLAASGKTVDVSDLQPGDIIFYSHEVNGRYKNISHVAIYIGDGMIIDARGKKYGVVKRAMPKNHIVMCGRPTM